MDGIFRIIYLVAGFFSIAVFDDLCAGIIDTSDDQCNAPSFRQATKELNTIYVNDWGLVSCNWTIANPYDNSCLKISFRFHGNDGTHFISVDGDEVMDFQTKAGEESEHKLQNLTVCKETVLILYNNNGSDIDDNRGLYLSYSAVLDTRLPEYHPYRKANTRIDVFSSTSKPKQQTQDDNEGPNGGIIAVAVIIPVLILAIGGCIFYIWYRKKYPVRMIVGKDFSKFSNPAYSKRISTATLVRSRSDDSFMHDVEEGMSAKGVSHDNPALNIEDESDYQPFHSGPSLVVPDFDKRFDESPMVERKKSDNKSSRREKDAVKKEKETVKSSTVTDADNDATVTDAHNNTMDANKERHGAEPQIDQETAPPGRSGGDKETKQLSEQEDSLKEEVETIPEPDSKQDTTDSKSVGQNMEETSSEILPVMTSSSRVDDASGSEQENSIEQSINDQESSEDRTDSTPEKAVFENDAVQVDSITDNNRSVVHEMEEPNDDTDTVTEKFEYIDPGKLPTNEEISENTLKTRSDSNVSETSEISSTGGDGYELEINGLNHTLPDEEPPEHVGMASPDSVIQESYVLEPSPDAGHQVSIPNLDQTTTQSSMSGIVVDKTEDNETHEIKNSIENVSLSSSDIIEVSYPQNENLTNENLSVSNTNLVNEDAFDKLLSFSDESFEIIDERNISFKSNESIEIPEETTCNDELPPNVRLVDHKGEEQNQMLSLPEDESSSFNKGILLSSSSHEDSSEKATPNENCVIEKSYLESGNTGRIYDSTDSLDEVNTESKNASESSINLSSSFEIIDKQLDLVRSEETNMGDVMSTTVPMGMDNLGDNPLDSSSLNEISEEILPSEQDMESNAVIFKDDSIDNTSIEILSDSISKSSETEMENVTNRMTDSLFKRETEIIDDKSDEKSQRKITFQQMSFDKSDSDEEEQLVDNTANDEWRGRKIEVGKISLNNTSSCSSESEEEDSVSNEDRPSNVRRESITLENPAFSSSSVGLRLQFHPREETTPTSQDTRHRRRKSITMDNPFFDGEGEPVIDVTENKLEGFHVVEASNIKEEVITESGSEDENLGGDGNEAAGVKPKKIVKVDLVNLSDEESFNADDVSVNSDVPSIDSDVSQDENGHEASFYQIQDSDDEYDV